MPHHERVDAQGFLPRKACERCHVQKLRCDSKEGSCTRCAKAGLTCVRGPSLRRQRAPRSKRLAAKANLQRAANSQPPSFNPNVSPIGSPQDGTASEMDYRSFSSPEQHVAHVSGNLKPTDLSVDTTWMTLSAMPNGVDYPADAFSAESEHSGHLQPPQRSLSAHPGMQMPPDMNFTRSKSLPDVMGPNNVTTPGRPDQRLSRKREQQIMNNLTNLTARLHENASWISQTRLSRSHPSSQPRSSPKESLLFEISGVSFEDCPQLKETFFIARSLIETLQQDALVAPRSQPASFLPSPASQPPDSALHPPQSRQYAGRSEEASSVFRSQASILYLLSSYLCLLETFEDIVAYFETELEKYRAFLLAQRKVGISMRLREAAKHAQIQLIDVLANVQSLLDQLRTSIHATGVMPTSDGNPGAAHGTTNDVTRPAVLAVQVRDCNLDNWVHRLQKTLIAQLGPE